MNSPLLTIAGLLGSCCSLWGQYAVLLDNSVVTNRVSLDVPGNLYSGVFGMEVWQSGNTNPSLSGTLDMTAMTNSLAAYGMLAANGFRLEQTYVAETMVQGVFALSGVEMPGVQPLATVTLALVAWNSTAPSWAAAVAG